MNRLFWAVERPANRPPRIRLPPWVWCVDHCRQDRSDHDQVALVIKELVRAIEGKELRNLESTPAPHDRALGSLNRRLAEIKPAR